MIRPLHSSGAKERNLPHWLWLSAGFCLLAVAYWIHLCLYSFLRGQEVRPALQLAHALAYFGDRLCGIDVRIEIPCRTAPEVTDRHALGQAP